MIYHAFRLLESPLTSPVFKTPSSGQSTPLSPAPMDFPNSDPVKIPLNLPLSSPAPGTLSIYQIKSAHPNRFEQSSSISCPGAAADADLQRGAAAPPAQAVVVQGRLAGVQLLLRCRGAARPALEIGVTAAAAAAQG